MAITTEDTRIIRTLIPDTEAVFGPAGDKTLFSDNEISDFYTAGSGSVLRAAALAVYAIATSEAMISKVIRTQDLQTNGATLSDALVKKGDALMKRADKIDDNESASYFQIINYRDGWGTYPPELTEWNWGY